jgi:diguanylate cyclase (GGDEF)-like protein/PAS domain S-box-containing protein
VTPTPQILIVDDEPGTIKILSRTLVGMGDLHEATSGAQALEIVSHQPIDLVLLDIIMPEMDGYDTCRALVRVRPDLPVIFVTMASDPASEIRALEVGGHDFISKPITPTVVRARVALHLKLQAQQAERQRAEQAIQALNAGLEQRVAERTTALEAEIAERTRVELALRESEQRFRELSANLERQVEARIAEVRATHTALKDSEERLRMFIDHAPAALAMFDRTMCYLAVSRRWKDDYGLGECNVIGLNLYKNFPNIPESWTALHRRALAGETHSADEDPFVCADGRLIWLRWEILPWHHQDQSVGGILIFSEDITEKKMARQEIEHLAFYDALTDLPNRVLAQERLQHEVASAKRHQTSLAVLYFDMDKFKYVNDTYGHAVGDLLLQGVAQRLTQHSRTGDLLSRLSGDEFMLVLPEVESVHIISQVSTVCENLLTGLAEPFDLKEVQLFTSFSIGVAIYPQDGNDAETLMRNADTAMYEAKKVGPQAYRFFEPEMNAALIRFAQIRDALRLALQRQEFELYYQPQVDLGSGRVIGVEALIRWNRIGEGLTLPGTFIEAAEESGLIVAIGWWVLREACRQAAAWCDMGWHDIVVAVNLSALQFRQGRLGQDVLDALEESGLDPSRLELELTESILLEPESSVLNTIANWKAHGIQLSIDDFGTGYSNLAYLKRFKVDKLKIDRSFIVNMEHDHGDQAIVQTIIQIADNMKLRTIAEGVESMALANQLKVIGCNEAQGYLYSEPLPAAEFEQWLMDYEQRARHT